MAASAENHQVKNARAWEDAGAAVCTEEKDLTADILADNILKLVNDDTLRLRMSNSASEFGNPDAASRIADHIEELLIPYRVS